jgi:topoisomerase-4 subunit A
MQRKKVEHDELLLHRYAEDAYLQYAIATVKDRALAQVEDGLKPVQRRILYTMSGLGLTAGAKPVKAARIVGEVLGKYHPHGDSAAYEAMVRMAQDFTLRYPLIAGQGNWGSRDGDAAAAYRYTEARLAPIAELLLTELHLHAVDFQPNYDGSQSEPTRLPARLPFLLLNGSTGIAVGMAANIPPHNLREVARAVVALIDKPDLEEERLLELLPGPDFPDGGQLVSAPEEIAAVYRTGRGALRCRARWRREELARGQWQIVVYELPYQVSTRRVLEQIEALCNPQPPAGKKALTPQQIALRQAALDMLEKATDESGKEDKVRLVLVPRSAKVDADALMHLLLANTSLEESIPVNMTVVGLDGRPQTKSLRQVLSEWVEYRIATVRRRTEHELEVVRRRIHLLEGRQAVFVHLDRVIRIIRESDDAKAALMKDIGLSEAQADDVLDMRLRQLNKLEGIELEKELERARKEASRLTKLLSSVSTLKRHVAAEVEADAERFGDERRTLIAPEARAASSAVVRAVVDEPVTVVLTKHLFVRARPGHEVDSAQLTYRPGDGPLAVVKTRTSRAVLLLDTRGRLYSIPANAVPSGRGDGVPLSTLVDVQDGARIAFALDAEPGQSYLFAGQAGFGFIAEDVAQLTTRLRAGKAFLSLDDQEEPLPPVPIPKDRSGWVVASSSDGRALLFPVSEVKALGKGKGVQLMKLEGGARVSTLNHTGQLQLRGRVQKKSGAVAVKLSPDKYVLHRGRRGRLLPKGCVLD